MNAPVERPWGRYTVLHVAPDRSYWLKLIEIDPRQRLSMQYHSGRSEFWFHRDGFPNVYVGDAPPFELRDFAVIRRGQSHRACNDSDAPASFIELAIGDCREDDIVRLADDYGRVA